MKKLFQVLVAVIGILAVAALILSFSIDGIVKSNIESTTAEMFNTSVTVDDVSLSILDGTGTIEGITIHNPKEFSDNPAVKLQQINMMMDLSTLLSDTVIINEFRIQQPQLYFEQKAKGNNFKALTENISGSSSSDYNLIVDYLLVKNGQVTLTSDIGKEKTVKTQFSQIEIKNIGRKGSSTVEQTVRQVLEPILQRALKEAVQKGLLEQAKDKLKDLLDGQ